MATTTATAVPIVFSVDDVATALDCHHRTVRAMIARGELPARKVGRALRIPIEAVLELAGTDLESYARLRTVLSCIEQGVDVTPDAAITEAAAAVLGSLPEGGGAHVTTS